MKTNNLIILAIVAIILISILAYVGLGIQTTKENNTTNDTINITINNTTNDTQNNTTETTKTTTKKSTSKSNEPKIVSDELQYNYQVDDGSYYRQVEYSDGNFRQIDTNGKIIGSSYKNDHVEGPSME